MSDRTYTPDVESTSFPRIGLPDDDGPRPPSGAALFPEIPTWTDGQLIIAIELADRREPELKLFAVGELPDRHEAFLDACSAELVGRLERRGAQLAA